MIPPRRPLAALAFLLIPTAFALADEPVKLAGSARFDLTADAKTGAIDDGRITVGDGSIDRPNWLPADRQTGSYTVNFPVSRIGWRGLSVRFTPRATGTVAVTLMGPWEQASPGVLYRQEVLWDDLKADGAKLADGGFEQGKGAEVPGWESRGGTVVVQTAEVAAASGDRYARTWHNETLSTKLEVTAGTPVTLHFKARAALPKGFREPKRILSHDTPAHRAAKRFRHGANFGNDLEVPPGQTWAVNYNADDIRHVRAEGFDHIRLPVGWHHYAGPAPEYRLSPAIFQRADRLIDAALAEKLGVMVNIHHFDDFTTDPAKNTAKFLAIWRQIAAHYANRPETLAFELLNESKDAATTEVINPIFAEAIREIRQTNPDRTIVVGPGRWNAISELPQLRVPDDDLNILVTVHCYDPFLFTHQGASWTGDSDDRKQTGFVFPGPPKSPLKPAPGLALSPGFLATIKAYNSLPTESNPISPRVMDQAVARIKEWSAYYGRPVYLGEFGAYTAADPTSRANYYRDFRTRLEAADIGWALWDWRAGFNYWNPKTNRPEPGMHEALFGGR
ncbi:glycoside hydrolase family 5 protein [Paludisphaera borealis]|uniref:Retaining beta-glycosidase n=1 Tax=Paludisphaera borealis TaxID=1387353 RepID=A0A1U7CR99_9BACT|nr:glycoside hydrolase family 5 protein [Paludisphaera borealis]APW61403.1 retaining beta-glycosidase [Paludisphaera borealis]